MVVRMHGTHPELHLRRPFDDLPAHLDVDEGKSTKGDEADRRLLPVPRMALAPRGRHQFLSERMWPGQIGGDIVFWYSKGDKWPISATLPPKSDHRAIRVITEPSE